MKKILNQEHKKKLSVVITSAFFLISVFALIQFQSCENNPNDLGLSYIPVNDTTNVRFLDSQTDSMQITNNNYRQYINTYPSDLLLVGNYESYTSNFLLKFFPDRTDLDSAEVKSATITLRYSDYYFKNKTGLTDFNIYNVVSNLDYSTITYDSVSSSDFGNKVMGSFSGNIPDSSSITLTLDNTLIADWLNYAADPEYPIKNNGIVFLPNMSSSTIKGFYLISNNVDYIPVIKAVVLKNGVTDTVTMNVSRGLFLSNAPYSIIPDERFLLQNGVAYKNILNFDLSKLPPNAIINNAKLQFYLDNSQSFITEGSIKRLVIGMVTDSVTKSDSLFFDCYIQDTTLYVVNLNSVFQRWSYGIMPNLGITLRGADYLENLDNFAIFSPQYMDVAMRPRLQITYTLRN